MPETAAIERLFSVCGLFDTAFAAKRGFQATANIAQVKADINLKYQHRTKKLGDGG